MFEVGEEVVCINAEKQSHTIEELNVDVPNWIKEGEKYRIRGFSNADFVVGVYLEEVKNPFKYFRLTGDTREPAFATWRFRKLQEDEVGTEVEQLEKVA